MAMNGNGGSATKDGYKTEGAKAKAKYPGANVKHSKLRGGESYKNAKKGSGRSPA